MIEAFLSQIKNTATYPLVLKGNDKHNFHNRINDHVIFPIVTALLHCAPQLEIIDLSYNEMKDRAATKLAELLNKCVNLKQLSLGSNSIGAEECLQIKKAL